MPDERDRRTTSRVPAPRLDDPTAEELRESIRLMRCWWCGRDRTKAGKHFEALSGHWTRGHGINLQHVRDSLDVPKTYAFISDAMHERLVARGKRRFAEDPVLFKQQLHPRGNPRQLSLHGKKVARVKAHKQREALILQLGEEAGRAIYQAQRRRPSEETRQRLGETAYRERLRQLAIASGLAQRKPRLCTVCKCAYWRKDMIRGREGWRPCSQACDRVRRSWYGIVEGRKRHTAALTSKTCPICSATFSALQGDTRQTCGKHACRSALIGRRVAVTMDSPNRVAYNEARKANPTSAKNRLLVLVPYEPIRYKALADLAKAALNIDAHNVSARLARLRKQGMVIRLRRGVWQRRRRQAGGN